MGTRRYWLFPFILIILIASASFILPNTRKRSVDITVISKGIPSHGVLLLASGDPSFEKNLSAALSNADISETEKLLSAFVINSSQRSVVAYNVRWTLADVNGKTVSHERIYKDLSLLMEHRDKQARDSEGFSIAAGSTRLISLIPFLSNAHQP